VSGKPEPLEFSDTLPHRLEMVYDLFATILIADVLANS
jgi:hypothetical protein